MAARLPTRKRSLFLPLANGQSPLTDNENGSSAMSPMTELAVNFHYNVNCEGSTPRRRLSLSDCKTTPTPKAASTESMESGIEVDGSSEASSLDDSPSCWGFLSKSHNSGVDNKLRRKKLYRRSITSPISSNEPLWFKEARRELSKENQPPRQLEKTMSNSSTCSEVVAISRNGDRFQPIEDCSCKELAEDCDESPFDLNRSLSAPPGLDSMEKYFEEEEDSNDCDGFSDFNDDDAAGGSESLPNSFSGLLNNPFVRNGSQRPSMPVSFRDISEENNTQNSSSLPNDVIFRRPKNSDLKTLRSLSFSSKRQEAPRDYSPVSRKRLKQRSQSVYQMSPMALRHVPEITSPIRFIRTQSLEPKGSPSANVSIQDRDEKNYIGDRSRVYRLPTVKGQHSDLKCISPHTLSKLMDNDYKNVVDDYIVIDCRYPYEYKAGHIKGAINIYTKEDAVQYFLEYPKFKGNGKTSILIFHCEFSSKRGPNMSRFLRNKDRDLHCHCYPKLYYPEIYILNGGYKEFYNEHKYYCDPVEYLPMVDTNHAQQLKFFAKRSKSWSENSTVMRNRTGLRY